MKKYTVNSAFSLLERKLIIPNDVVYAELVRNMYHLYDPKTRKRLGTISENNFLGHVTETPE